MSDTSDLTFQTLAGTILDELLARHPEWATTLGVHTHDDRLPDGSAEAMAAESALLATRAADLAAVDLATLSTQNRVDALILANFLASLRFGLDELREAEWNPAEANPGSAIMAMRLMQERGFQEEGEASGKWRRALLSSAQLSTYYVGYVEVSDLVRDLRAAHPEWSERELHDAVLGHGSPAVRHLRVLVGV
jgi:uncharacterized protein (DUF885 family)